MGEEWYYKPEWWEAFGTILAAIITLLAAIIALLLGIAGIFQDWLYGLVFHPSLTVTVSKEDPYLASGRWGQNGIHHYLSLKLENSGHERMLDVGAMMLEVHKLIGDKYMQMKGFVPTKMQVAGMEGKYNIPTLQPELPCFFNIGHFKRTAGKTQLDFCYCLEFVSNMFSNPLEVGTYKIKIAFFANNCKVEKKEFLLKFQDSWDDDPMAMKNFISIEEIKN